MNRRALSHLPGSPSARAAVRPALASLPMTIRDAEAGSDRVTLFHEAEQTAHDLRESRCTYSAAKRPEACCRDQEVGE